MHQTQQPLNERIKAHRRAAGLSQEALAARLGVSRQAVAKWESGQSAPSTENLFYLAQIFGTTVDLLLPPPGGAEPSPPLPESGAESPAASARSDPAAAVPDTAPAGGCAPDGAPVTCGGAWSAPADPAAPPPCGSDPSAGSPTGQPFAPYAAAPTANTAADPAAVAAQLHALQKQEREQAAAARRARRVQNGRAALLCAGIYLALYLLGRLLWCVDDQTTVLGWLFAARPKGEGSYLFGWLLHGGRYWWCVGLSVGLALAGKRVLALTTAVGFVVGFWLGVWLGPTDWGTGEYGWAWWLFTVLASLPVGAVLQRMARRRATPRGGQEPTLFAAAPAASMPPASDAQPVVSNTEAPAGTAPDNAGSTAPAAAQPAQRPAETASAPPALPRRLHRLGSGLWCGAVGLYLVGFCTGLFNRQVVLPVNEQMGLGVPLLYYGRSQSAVLLLAAVVLLTVLGLLLHLVACFVRDEGE